MIVEAKAPRGEDIDRSVSSLVFRAKTQLDRNVLAALLSLWNEKPDAFCGLVKARVLSRTDSHGRGRALR